MLFDHFLVIETVCKIKAKTFLQCYRSNFIFKINVITSEYLHVKCGVCQILPNLTTRYLLFTP